MEGNTNWRPNQQGGDSLVNNANDWRSQFEPDLRKKIVHAIVGRLNKYFPQYTQEKINESAIKFEETAFLVATDKGDYMHKITGRMNMMEAKFRNAQSHNVQSGSSANGTTAPDPAAAQVLNQGQSLPNSLPYTQTPTSQQWQPQNIQSNPNIPGSSGMQNQVSITVSGGPNINIQMSEGVSSNLLPSPQIQMHGRPQVLSQQPQPQPQQQLQNSSYTFQHQMNQQLLKEKIRHGNLRPPYMQQQAQPQQQQTSLSTIPQSFPQSSSLPSSAQQTSIQQNSQFLPRHHFPTQPVRSSHQQKRREQEQLISQLMNGPDTQQNHLTSQQNNGEQQGAFRVSSSQQNNIAAFQTMAQQNNNLQNMHQRRLSSQSNNASALPLQQQQKLLGGQSGNFNAPGSSLLATQGQEVGQSQPMMLQQRQPQHPMQQQQHLESLQNDSQRFQAAGSLRQTHNILEQQNQPYQLQRAPLENSSTSQDSTSMTVNASGGDWQEETYQKIKTMKDMYLSVLHTMFQKVSEKLLQIDSGPQQKIQYEHEQTERLRAIKLTLEQLIVFLNVHRKGVTEKHRDRFSLYEDHILKLTKSQTGHRRPMQQQQQGQFPPSQMLQTAPQSQSPRPQVHVSQCLDNNQMNSRLMPSYQNGASSSVSGLTAMPHLLQIRPKMEPGDENNTMASSGSVVLPSLKQSPAIYPQMVHPNISSVQSSMFHHRQRQEQLLHRQHPQQQKQANQQVQMTNEMNDVRTRQGINIKAGLLQQHLSSSQRQLPKPLAAQARMSNFLPSTSSPQIQHHNSSPQLVDQQILPATFNKTGTPSQSSGSPFVVPSPMTPFAPSPTLGDPEKPISVESPVSHAYQFQTAAQSPSSFGVVMNSTLEHPQFTLPPEPIAERPIDRLIKAFQSSSPKSLAESVSEMSSVISMADRFAGSFHPGGGSRAGVAEDLSARTEFHLQAEDLITHGETNPTKRIKRSFSTLPLDIASQLDTYKKSSSLESEVDSTASSDSKVNKIESGYALLQEIKEINGRLVETVVDICEKDVYPSEVMTSGTIVTCTYAPVAFSSTFKAHYNSGQISQIQPLRLLVPANYPYSPPIFLEQLPFGASVHNYEDLSMRTRSRFSLSMTKLSEPMSLKEIAQTWNDSARETMVEYAERHGGGTFSSKYGSWETVLRAS